MTDKMHHKARFVGDPADGFSGADEITVWGTEFHKGKWREVSKAVADQARTHSHFEVVDEAVKPAKAATGASE